MEQGFDADDSDTREEAGLREIIDRDVDFGEVGGFGGLNDIDDTANGADLAVKREFTDEEFLVEVGNKKIAREDENG